MLIKKVSNCKAETIHQATLSLLNEHKDRIYTITIDNGSITKQIKQKTKKNTQLYHSLRTFLQHKIGLF